MKTKISSLVLCLLAGVLFTTGCGSSNNEVVEPIQDSAIRVILDRGEVDTGEGFYHASTYEFRVINRNGDDVLPIYDLDADYDINGRMIVDLYGVPATAATNSTYDIYVTADGELVDIDDEFYFHHTRVAGPVTTIHGQTIEVGDGTAYPFALTSD